MAPNRILKYFNIAVLLLLATAAFAAYWYAWRPLPQTSGVLQAPVGGPAAIARDALGVPHVSAAGAEDALFLQGYATAQDRLWQMDALRRVAAGRLAEVLGPTMLEADRESRRLRMARIAEQHAAMLPAADRAVLAAYARGVNFFIESHAGRLPLEFSLLRYEPDPWRVSDSILVGLHMYRILTTDWPRELQKRRLLEGGDADKVSFLFPARAGRQIQPGSNAWVLAGSRTASGRPLLANDPHLEWSLPGIWHMVRLRAPGLNVSGVTLPGVPCVILGHNERIAWGVTNLEFDVQDLYLVKLDPQTGRYAFRGRTEQALMERDTIPVRNGAPVEFAQWVTRHGPVFREGDEFLALRWAAAEPGAFAFPFLELNRARNWQEFTAALARYPGPGQNFVYADVEGNIGYQATGRLPIRNHTGDLPADGDYEWEGFIPFEHLPRSFNPPSGMIVTANQNPFPADYPYQVSGNFASPYRAEQIQALLSARKGWLPEDMASVQKDVYSRFAHALARELVAAWDRRQGSAPALADAIDILRVWDGQMEKRTAAPLVATLAARHLEKAVVDRASPGNAVIYNIGVPGEWVQMAPAVLEVLLRERPKNWFGDYDDLLLRTLEEAIDEGRRLQGRNLRNWDYGRYNRLLLANPVLSRVPLVGGYFNIGPAPQSGSATTVKQTTRRVGPSMRMTADLSDWDRSLMNIAIGQSGHALSRHYRDQWRNHYSGGTFRWQFQRVEARSTLTILPYE